MVFFFIYIYNFIRKCAEERFSVFDKKKIVLIVLLKFKNIANYGPRDPSFERGKKTRKRGERRLKEKKKQASL